MDVSKLSADAKLIAASNLVVAQAIRQLQNSQQVFGTSETEIEKQMTDGLAYYLRQIEELGPKP